MYWRLYLWAENFIDAKYFLELIHSIILGICVIIHQMRIEMDFNKLLL